MLNGHWRKCCWLVWLITTLIFCLPKFSGAQTTDTLFRVVEQMPVYDPFCLEEAGKMDQRECSNTKLLQFIYSQFKYPAMETCMAIEGTIVVCFVIEKDGSMSSLEVIRDPGGGLGEEALRVFQLLASDGEKWMPGQQFGQPVRVQLYYPIKIHWE